MSTQDEPVTKKLRATPVACPHGNYKKYYVARHASGGLDSRLQLLDEAWFRGKKCLDIGCNDGTFTRQIARMFGCAYMLGIDIDSRLIDSAWEATPFPPPVVEQAPASSVPGPVICWRREDVTTDEHPDQDGYDTISCFSVVKWIHLLHGDRGLVKLFQKVRCLTALDGRPRGNIAYLAQ